MRTQVELPNDVAVELAGSQDAVLRALQAHLQCKVFLRGNLLTLDGEESETHVGERVVRELSELISRGHQIGPGTIALFYYAGHGLQNRGSNYLVPVSANLSSSSDIDFELVDLDIVVRQMDAAHASLNVIALDACRNNPFGGRGLRAPLWRSRAARGRCHRWARAVQAERRAAAGGSDFFRLR